MPRAAKVGIVMQYLPNKSMHELLEATRSVDIVKALRCHKRGGRYILPRQHNNLPHPLLQFTLSVDDHKGSGSRTRTHDDPRKGGLYPPPRPSGGPSAQSVNLWDLIKFPFLESRLSAVKPAITLAMVRSKENTSRTHPWQ